MPYYTTLPADWQTELEKVAGAKPVIEVVYDPDGENLVLSGKHSLISISPITQLRDMDIDYFNRPITYDLRLTFNDADNYFNPTNTTSPFYNCTGELDRKHYKAGSSIKLLDKEGVSFAVGRKVIINDGTNSQTMYIDGFTAAAGSVYYHEITYNAGLSYNFDKGTRVYTDPNEKKKLVIKVKMTGCVNYVTAFQGYIIRNPECSNGQATITVTGMNKFHLDEELRGADSDATNKIKRINTTGVLADSINVGDSLGTLDRTKIKVFDNAKLDEWTLEFSSATAFTLHGRDTNIGVTGGTDLETVGVLTALDYPFYFEYPYSIAISNSGYAYIACGSTHSTAPAIIIVDVNDPANMEIAGTLTGDGSPNYLNGVIAVLIDGNYLYTISGTDKYLSVFDITNPTVPVLVGTLADIATSLSSRVDICIQDDYLYFVNALTDEFKIIDIRNPASPAVVGTLSGAGAPNYLDYVCGVEVYGDYAYVVAQDNSSFVIIDISNKSAPSVTSHVVKADLVDPFDLFSPLDIAINDDATYAYITVLLGRLTIFDISNKASPSYVITLDDADPPYLSSAFKLEYRDNRCYVMASADDAVTVIDVTDPTNPTVADNLVGAGAPNYLDLNFCAELHGDYAFICAVGESSLTAVRISSSDTSIGNESIRIPTDAFAGTFADGDEVILSTAISWENTNVASVLQQLLEDYALIDSSLVDRSSYFGDRNVGKLKSAYAAGETSISVAIKVPMLIKTGETLTITEGTLTEDVTVATGNAVTSKYPPSIALTVSALVNSYTSAATVVWKERSDPDTDFSFDAEYHYFDIMAYNISISFDRTMSILQATEDVGRHGDCFTFQDNWGVEKIYTFRPHYWVSLPTFAHDTNLALPAPTMENVEMVNEINVLYGYDYVNSVYQYMVKYPEDQSKNKSQIRHGFVRSRTVSLPGVWTKDYAKSIAAHKYFFWENGLDMVKFATTMQGMLMTTGDRLTIDCDLPVLATELEIIGIAGIQLLTDLSFEFIAYVSKFIWNNYFLVADSGIETGRVLW